MGYDRGCRCVDSVFVYPIKQCVHVVIGSLRTSSQKMIYPPKLTKYVRQGTYGKIYISTVNNKQLAVKKVPKDESEDEIRNLLAVQGHQSICLMIDHFSTEKYNYIYMPYYPKNLNDRIYKEIIAPAQRALYLTQLLDGLDFLRSKSIIHRDLTPSNICLDPDIKICDFGMSCIESKDPLSTNVCTINYHAWEILNGDQHYDCSSDMWSLGCILAEMTTQSILYDGDDQQDVIQSIVSVKIAGLEEFLGFQEYSLLCRMLVKNPIDRIQPKEAQRLLTI